VEQLRKSVKYVNSFSEIHKNNYLIQKDEENPSINSITYLMNKEKTLHSDKLWNVHFGVLHLKTMQKYMI